jgi:hypothetical protein
VCPCANGRASTQIAEVLALALSTRLTRDIDELRQLNEDYQRLQRGKERNPALWIILSIITLGIAFLFVLWFLNA